MNQMVVTNWRTDIQTYNQAKTMASSLGMSMNEYLNTVIETKIKSDFLGSKLVITKKNKKDKYQAMWKFIDRKYKSEPMGLSIEDETIYE